MIAQLLPDLPNDLETARVVWNAGQFWIAIIAGLGGLGSLIWVTAVRFSRLDTTLKKLDESVDKLSTKVGELADHEVRIYTLEQWRLTIDAWMRRRNGG